jgi:hypothetical protein
MDSIQLQKLYDDGLSLSEIGILLNKTTASVFRLFKKYKLKTDQLRRKTGDKSPKWKGGRIKRGGYIYIQMPNHPRAKKDGYVPEHTLVMEKHIGRYLKKDEVAHHRNEIKSDNEIKNLRLMTESKHKALHASINNKKRPKKIKPIKIKRIIIWTKKHDCCIKCGSPERKHASKGLCTRCDMYARTVKQRGYKVKYANGKRVFSRKHRKNLSIACGRKKNKMYFVK